MIRRRLEIYRAEVGPLEEHYAASGLLARVAGERAPDDVTAEILDVVRKAQALRRLPTPMPPTIHMNARRG